MIKGSQLRDAFISGANSISNCRQQVDALNVFPVPDGDTGTNMSMTINAAKRELETLKDDPTVEQVSKKAASALLRGARGNSGVILSLLFRGFSKGLEGKEEADAKDIAHALSLGVSAAYKAVMKPTEGTILTVARLASEHAQQVAQQEEVTEVMMWKEILSAAEDALAQTPEMLPVLKKAGVVDAGGQGFVEIWKGMLSVIENEQIIPSEEEAQAAPKEKKAHGVAAEFNEEDIHFCYCTEFIINKEHPDADPLSLRAYLESIGDCVVVVDDEEIIKCHVHTNEPGNAIQAALKLGYLTNMKIDNMKEQHGDNNKLVDLEAEGQPAFPYKAVDPDKEYGFVAIAAGEGVKQLFVDLGVDNVVSGGQTMNPSTDDILSAIHATAAKRVFVLPNNKNIIMAAEQAANLADRKVDVLQTRTIPQGLSAMLAFDPEADRKQNVTNMVQAYERVGTGSVTFAARDSDYEGHKIKKGELLALENGKMSFVDTDLKKTVVKLTHNLTKKSPNKDASFVTLIYGEDVAEDQAEEIREAVAERLGDSAEVVLIAGKQPVYYFIISVE
ncbi:DAK2 domain-containing protein [Negativibacillus massiliensis]|uniref:DAK2 domain-containing protein n=1 Tax=Negativibacillus massiliensis TaxID=1871035 RepID=UPI0003349CEB|nr:DAK2 domain-containing protein [Negativibacillus massiliensis]MDY4046852.1 DAK2 domain-containing protein [Negativibacillus massiliensis]CDA76130.1 dAK2 domain fusion protein YloV [Clostridium sp. CAG:242]